MLEGIINIRPTLKGTLSQVSTRVSGWASAFGWPHGPSPQADTQPDTRVNTRPRIPFKVGLIYVSLHQDDTCLITFQACESDLMLLILDSLMESTVWKAQFIILNALLKFLEG